MSRMAREAKNQLNVFFWGSVALLLYVVLKKDIPFAPQQQVGLPAEPSPKKEEGDQDDLAGYPTQDRRFLAEISATLSSPK